LVKFYECQTKRLQLDNSKEASSGDITNTDVQSKEKNVGRPSRKLPSETTWDLQRLLAGEGSQACQIVADS